MGVDRMELERTVDQDSLKSAKAGDYVVMDWYPRFGGCKQTRLVQITAVKKGRLYICKPDCEYMGNWRYGFSTATGKAQSDGYRGDVMIRKATDAEAAAYLKAEADREREEEEKRQAQIREVRLAHAAPAMYKALRTISGLWPEPPDCADILSVNGINDGRSRAILAVTAAIKIARAAIADLSPEKLEATMEPKGGAS